MQFVLLAGIGALGWHGYTGQRAHRQLREAGFVEDGPPWLGAHVWWAARQDWRLVFNSEVWESRPATWRLDGARAGALRKLDAVAPALRRVNPEQISIAVILKPVASWQELEARYRSGLQNVDGLKGLTGLQTLDLFQCYALQNIDGLKGLTGLRVLCVTDCPALQDVDGLKGLTGLRTLKLYRCVALQNVDRLKELTGLQSLDLSGCDALQDVDGLKGLTGLQTLDLRFCPALQNVDGLKGLTGLRTLNLWGCSKISAPALRDLRAALPNTIITFPDNSKSPPQ